MYLIDVYQVMFAPDDKWRCTEDLKVILITKQGRLSRQLALPFFRQFGKVTGCYVMQSDRIACASYTTEEDAEKALNVKSTNIYGMFCDVTTFKAGNRKIYISPITLSETSYRSYFESKYGEILRFEALPGQTAAFILFRKVDSAVACRNKYHYINGVNVHALPGCNTGALYQPSRSTMYRIEPTPSNNKPVVAEWPWASHDQNNEAVCPYNMRGELSQSSLHVDFPQFKPLLEKMKDLSMNEIDGWDKKFKMEVSKSDLVKNWIKSQENEEEEVEEDKEETSGVDWSRVEWTSGPALTLTKKDDEEEEVKVENEEKWLKQKLHFESLFPPSEKELRWEERRKELNLPPTDKCAHYARDEEGFPIHYNGKYVMSIFRDGRYIIPKDTHVSFDKEKNTVKVFERADYEYESFRSKGPRKAKGRRVKHDNDYGDDEGWEDGSEINCAPSKDPFPHHLNWPFKFPAKPRHFPLMDYCRFQDDSFLQVSNSTRYMDQLQDRWNNTKHNDFFTTFAPFLRDSCTICNVKLDGPKKQFEHIFSRPHLANLNRHNVRYTLSDFTFWNNLLLCNFHTGVKKRSSR